MDRDLITEQTAQLLAEKLPATEHAAFIAWIRPLLGHTDSSKLALDSDWCRGALAGWAARSIYRIATPTSPPDGQSQQHAIIQRLERTLVGHQIGHDQSDGGEHSKGFIKGFAECTRLLRETYEGKSHG